MGLFNSKKQPPEYLAEKIIQDPTERTWNFTNKKLDDQMCLAQVAVKARNFEVRQYASYKLTDTSALLKVALEGFGQIARNAAYKTNDKTALVEIVMNAQDMDARSTAIEKLKNDPALLLEFAANNPIMWGQVIGHITDQSILQDIILNGKGSKYEIPFEPRQNAWKNLTIESAKIVSEKYMSKEYGGVSHLTACREYGHRKSGETQNYSETREVQSDDGWYLEKRTFRETRQICAICGGEFRD